MRLKEERIEQLKAFVVLIMSISRCFTAKRSIRSETIFDAFKIENCSYFVRCSRNRYITHDQNKSRSRFFYFFWNESNMCHPWMTILPISESMPNQESITRIGHTATNNKYDEYEQYTYYGNAPKKKKTIIRIRMHYGHCHYTWCFFFFFEK